MLRQVERLSSRKDVLLEHRRGQIDVAPVVKQADCSRWCVSNQLVYTKSEEQVGMSRVLCLSHDLVARLIESSCRPATSALNSCTIRAANR
jgi:hypothetical protein